MKDSRVAELLETLTPSYDDRDGDWERVAAAAGRRPRTGASWWAARAAAVATAAAAIGALVLGWPLQAEQPGLLERARAAIGEGPVLHVVLRGEWGGTLVDLESGARTPVYGENEHWYDRGSGRVRSVSRLGGVVQHDVVFEPKEPPAPLAALGRDYARALESGNAQTSGEDTIDGEPVVWISIRSELLPDVADGKDHEWAQQVAISRRTFKPVALRATRDGEPGPGTTQRVLELELLPAGAADFSAPGTETLDGTAFSEGREPIPLEEARETLGRTPVWLGREHRGLPLAAAFRETTRTGRRREVRVTGPEAEAALECVERRGGGAAACLGALAPGGSLTVRPDGVFRAEGPIVWSEGETALVLFYGTVGDDETTYRKDLVPLYDRPHLTITQSTRPSPLRPGTGRYRPPAGSVFVAAGARTGVLQSHGILVAIEAADEEAILAAARALEPMSD